MIQLIVCYFVVYLLEHSNILLVQPHRRGNKKKACIHLLSMLHLSEIFGLNNHSTLGN